MSSDPATIPPSPPSPGRYRHHKGGSYTVLGTGRHSETEEWLVIYRAEKDGSLWLRPLSSWNEPVSRSGGTVPRFAPDGT